MLQEKILEMTIFKDYKANRGETPEDLIPQFEIIRECVRCL